jgi:hypothetical protein
MGQPALAPAIEGSAETSGVVGVASQVNTAGPIGVSAR